MLNTILLLVSKPVIQGQYLNTLVMLGIHKAQKIVEEDVLNLQISLDY